MTEQFQEFLNVIAEAEVERCRKIVNWWDKNKKPAQSNEQAKNVRKTNFTNTNVNNNTNKVYMVQKESNRNKNHYFGEITEVTNKRIGLEKGTPMRFINVQPDYQEETVSFGINLTQDFENKNNKQLSILNILDPSTHITSKELETVNLNSLVGKRVEFILQDDGKHIKEFVKVLDDLPW